MAVDYAGEGQNGLAILVQIGAGVGTPLVSQVFAACNPPYHTAG